MIGYPITYGDTLEEVNSFTSEMVITEISEYWSNEQNRINFNKGYKLGLLVFGIASLVLISTRPAFAADSGVLPNNNGAPGVLPNNNGAGGGGSCPETGPTQSGTPAPAPGPGPGNPGSLAKVPTPDRTIFGGSALGICSIAMKSGSYWVGFVCAAAILIGIRMGSVPPENNV